MRTISSQSGGLATQRPEAGPLEEAFRLAMRQLTSQVSIIAAGSGPDLTGMTVTSVASLSLEPPAISLAVAKSASIHPVLMRSRRFGLSGLAAGHRLLADRFAGRDGSKGAARFTAGAWTGLDGGAPLLEDAVYRLVCEIAETVDWHSHTVVLARVVAAEAEPGKALAYRDGGYAIPAAAP